MSVFPFTKVRFRNFFLRFSIFFLSTVVFSCALAYEANDTNTFKGCNQCRDSIEAFVVINFDTEEFLSHGRLNELQKTLQKIAAKKSYQDGRKRVMNSEFTKKKWFLLMFVPCKVLSSRSFCLTVFQQRIDEIQYLASFQLYIVTSSQPFFFGVTSVTKDLWILNVQLVSVFFSLEFHLLEFKFFVACFQFFGPPGFIWNIYTLHLIYLYHGKRKKGFYFWVAFSLLSKLIVPYWFSGEIPSVDFRENSFCVFHKPFFGASFCLLDVLFEPGKPTLASLVG